MGGEIPIVEGIGILSTRLIHSGKTLSLVLQKNGCVATYSILPVGDLKRVAFTNVWLNAVAIALYITFV